VSDESIDEDVTADKAAIREGMMRQKGRKTKTKIRNEMNRQNAKGACREQ